MSLLRAEARRRCPRPHHARENAGSGQRSIGGKSPRLRYAKEGGTSLKDGEACPSCVACVRMPEAASGTSAEKSSSTSRVGRHCILKKRRRSLPLPASRVRMLEAASDALAKKPLSASRAGRRYILKKTEKITPAHVTCGRPPSTDSAPSAGNPLVRVTRGKALHPEKRRRNLLPPASRARGRGRCLWRGNPAWFQARWNGAAALVRRVRTGAERPLFARPLCGGGCPCRLWGKATHFVRRNVRRPAIFAGGKQGNSAFSQKTTCQAGCTSCMLVSEES